MVAPDSHEPRSRAPITLRKVVVTEGYDLFKFIKALVSELGLLETLEIRNAGGVNEIGPYLRAIPKLEGFTHVSALGVIRDAEANAAAAFASVSDALAAAGFVKPQKAGVIESGAPNVAVFLLPDGARPGMLETLCLDSVSGDAALACVDEFFRCLDDRGLDGPQQFEKAKVQVFLASRPEPCPHIGLGAQKGYWSWSSPVFDPLKGFLQSL